MKKHSRKHWTSEEARQVLARAAASGLSDHAYARQQGLCPQRLRWWRKRLEPSLPPPAHAPAFVEVKLPAAVPSRPFVVHARNGRRLRVWPGFDAAELRRLLAALEEAEPC